MVGGVETAVLGGDVVGELAADPVGVTVGRAEPRVEALGGEIGDLDLAGLQRRPHQLGDAGGERLGVRVGGDDERLHAAQSTGSGWPPPPPRVGSSTCPTEERHDHVTVTDHVPAPDTTPPRPPRPSAPGERDRPDGRGRTGLDADGPRPRSATPTSSCATSR